MPAHHKYHKPKTLLLEAEPEPSNPGSFLAKCKAIVEEITEPVVKSVPLVIRHRVHDLRPRARAAYFRRQVKLHVPEWNATNCKRLEKILGVVLIFIAFLLLRPEDSPTVRNHSTAPAPQAVDTSTFASAFLNGETTPAAAPATTTESETSTVDVPWLSEAAIDPALLQALEPQSNAHPFGRFHSYANPATRFDFNNNSPAWNSSYRSSTHAACGMAKHFQHSMPVMLRRGNAPAWHSDPHGTRAHMTAQQASNHPLVHKMMKQTQQHAFQHYVNTSSYNATAIPMARVAHQYHSLSQVLKSSCDTGEKSSEEGE